VLFTDENLGIEIEFPAAYHAPRTWGWSLQEAASGLIQKRKGLRVSLEVVNR
jgi:hypothetical protein